MKNRPVSSRNALDRFANAVFFLFGLAIACLILSGASLGPSGETPAPLTDFGDAPDTYGTTIGAGGAQHLQDPWCWLGEAVDYEEDGYASEDASGDDLHDVDDEDGVVFLEPLMLGETISVSVAVAGNGGLLNAWLDFDRNGNFLDPVEQIFTDVELAPGQHTLVFTLPPEAVAGMSFARFRLNKVGGLGPTGTAETGEVEDYRVWLEDSDLDFGDLPDRPYPTLFASDGARHVVGELRLGVHLDAESDGQPTPDARGDDASGGPDDEDGVTFPVMARRSTVNIEVVASGEGKLNAWIDWDKSETFEPEEHVADGVTVSAGTNLIPVEVSSSAALGEVYARFRLSSLSRLEPWGRAPDGEVEDYLILISEGASDFGDLPGSGFRTLRAEDGPRHEVVPDFRLGDMIDEEPDGLPSAHALGDDENHHDDEDGIIMPYEWPRGSVVPVVAMATGTGYLNVWVDFDESGDFQPEEHVVDDGPVVSGRNSFNITVPETTDLSYKATRFRLSTQSGLNWYGWAPDGEVEDHEITIVDPVYDFGDLDLFTDPPYPTLLGSDGARHVLVPDVYLGDCISTEGDARGTDTCNDALQPYSLSQGMPGEIGIVASTEGYVSAWFDGNLDGVFSDPEELAVIDYPVGPGETQVPFSVPNELEEGAIMRLRFSTVPGLAVDGEAPNGEVEDHLVDISPRDMDYGDLPDPPYPTLLSSDGPRHGNYTGGDFQSYLGIEADYELDGQPNEGATGDDDDGTDDDDGITHVAPMVPGHMSSIGVLVAESGYLAGWIDFNDDGDFNDADEFAIQNVFFDNEGVKNVPFWVPPDATGNAEGWVYERFRMSDTPFTSYFGVHSFGEVEDYRVQLAATATDYGDAPASYEQGNPASHTADFDFCLGSLVDPDFTAQSSPKADLDDIHYNDEDGVDLGAFFVGVTPCGSETIDIEYENATGNTPYLDAWIDYDQNGVFDHPAERIIHAHDLSTETSFDINFPCSATPGRTFARFRLSTTGGLAPTGPGGLGEVEDYEFGDEVDFGDLPDPFGVNPGYYPTLLANDGPHHIIVPDCYLGYSVDADPDGQPIIDASGDDGDGGDDEDGVIITNYPVVPGDNLEMMITFQVAGCSGNNRIRCWIDWNRNGVLDSDEKFERSITATVDSGTIPHLEVASPGWIDADMGLRCRVGGFFEMPDEPTGLANEGEVEDYMLSSSMLDIAYARLTASVEDRDVVLYWSAAEVEETRVFVVEHTRGENPFLEIGEVIGGGRESFTFVFKQADFGKHRFRLKETGTDGGVTYSPQVEVVVEMRAPAVLDPVYPNPFNPTAIITFAVRETGPVLLEPFAIDGRHVRTVFNSDVLGGVSHTVRLDAAGLPSGSYLLRLSASGYTAHRAVMLVR